MVMLAQAGTDIEGHWAEQVINRWVDRKIVDGYPDGTFRPNAPIRRAEFAALINRTFGYSTPSSVAFDDVVGNEWFANDISRAVGAGYMDGYPEGVFKPNANISRQEAAMVLARINGLEETDETFDFIDINSIPAWSRWAVVAAARAGLMTGYPDGSFSPTASFTRAETVTVLDRLVAEVFTEEGIYGNADEQMVIEGNVVVLAENVELCNYHITGDLLIAESVGEGTVTLDRVIVDGGLAVKGGGANSVVIKDSTIVTLIIDKEGVRVVIQEGTQVSEAYVRTSSRVEQDAVGKGIASLTIEEILDTEEVVLSGSFANVSIRAESGKIVVDGGHVDEIILESDAADVVVELGSNASVANLVLDAPATVGGTGTIQTATVNASGAVIEQQPKELVLPEGTTANIGGEDVTGSAPVIVTPSDPYVPIPDQDQPEPTGLEGVAPTSADNVDGKIIRTTTAMEYKIASAEDSAYVSCGDGETTGLAAGGYVVRFAAKEGYNASPVIAVTVPGYVAPEVEVIDVSVVNATTVTFSSNVTPTAVKWNDVAYTAILVKGTTYKITIPAANVETNYKLTVEALGYTTFEKSDVTFTPAAWDGIAKEEVIPQGDIYEIRTGAELAWIAEQANLDVGPNTFAGKTVKLMNNIDLGGKEWTPIGNGIRNGYTVTGNSFQGLFEGNHKTVSNLKITASDTIGGEEHGFGLIGSMTKGSVKNLTVINPQISGTGCANGAIVGFLSYGYSVDDIDIIVVDNCAVIGGSISGQEAAGGVIGRLIGSTGASDNEAALRIKVQNCQNSGTEINILSNNAAGGIIGNQYRTNSIDQILIRDCVNSGNVTSPHMAGGIAGQIANGTLDGGSNTGTIIGGYNSSSIHYYGGHLIGYTTGARIRNVTELFDLKNVFETEGGMPVYVELAGNITATGFRGEVNTGAPVTDQDSIAMKNCRFLDILDHTTLEVSNAKTINLYTEYNNTLRGEVGTTLTITGAGSVNIGLDASRLKHFFTDVAGTIVAADAGGNVTKGTYGFVVKSGDNANRNQEIWVLESLKGSFIVSSGKTLAIEAGRTFTVAEGAILQVDGTLNVDGVLDVTGTANIGSGATLTNNGTVMVASSGALEIGHNANLTTAVPGSKIIVSQGGRLYNIQGDAGDIRVCWIGVESVPAMFQLTDGMAELVLGASSDYPLQLILKGNAIVPMNNSYNSTIGVSIWTGEKLVIDSGVTLTVDGILKSVGGSKIVNSGTLNVNGILRSGDVSGIENVGIVNINSTGRLEHVNGGTVIGAATDDVINLFEGGTIAIQQGRVNNFYANNVEISLNSDLSYTHETSGTTLILVPYTATMNQSFTWQTDRWSDSSVSR
jgi:hypothetical protein